MPAAESATERQTLTVNTLRSDSAVEGHLAQGHSPFWPAHIRVLIDTIV